MDNIETWKNTAKRMIDFLSVTWKCSRDVLGTLHQQHEAQLSWFCCGKCGENAADEGHTKISPLIL